jgi:3-hydroxyisobutyrate dehydrogenase
MRIAVLGLGRMGAALAGRLVEEGHDVVVWNRSPGKGGELVDAGAKEASSIDEAVTSADVAVTFVSDDDAVRHVALDDGGVVASLAPESIYVDCSTVSPAMSAELAGAAGAERFVAMPVLGSPAAVRSGQGMYLAGGRDDVLDRLQPMVASLSKSVRRYPEPPLALTAKLTSNLVLLAGVATLAEAFAVGRAGGLTDDQLRELLAESPVVAPALHNRFEGVLGGDQDAWWTTTLGAKDARLAAALAEGDDVDVPVADAVRERFAEAARRGLDDADIVAVAQLYRRG